MSRFQSKIAHNTDSRSQIEWLKKYQYQNGIMLELSDNDFKTAIIKCLITNTLLIKFKNLKISADIDNIKKKPKELWKLKYTVTEKQNHSKSVNSRRGKTEEIISEL